MKITIENTDQIVTVETRDGGKVPARVWRGVTDGGAHAPTTAQQGRLL